MGLGLRAAAKQLGVSHVALAKALKTGRVTALPDGSFDLKACRAAWKANTHPVRAKAAREQKSRRQQTAPLSEDSTLAEAIRRKECALARRRELELAVFEGGLITVGDATMALAPMIAACRARLLAIPSSLATEVALESDPAACEALIREKVHDALKELSELPTGKGREER